MERMWVEREPPEPLVWFACVCYTGAGVWAWYRDGWVVGLLTFFVVGLVSGLLVNFVWYCVAAVPLPADACSAQDTVKQLFRQANPNAKVENVGVRAIEPGRVVISVMHRPGGRTVIEPSPIRYFAVSRTGPLAITELAAEDWLPRGRK